MSESGTLPFLHTASTAHTLLSTHCSHTASTVSSGLSSCVC